MSATHPTPSAQEPGPAQVRALQLDELVRLGGVYHDSGEPLVALTIGPDASKGSRYLGALRACGLRVLPLDAMGEVDLAAQAGLELVWQGPGSAAAAGTLPGSLGRGGARERATVTVSGLVLTGGGDIDPGLQGRASLPCLVGVAPERDRRERAWFEEAWSRQVPVLGICRGMQVMSWCLGGTLYLDLESEQRPHASQGTASIDHRPFDHGHPKTETCHDVIWGEQSVLASYYHPTGSGSQASGERRTAVNSDHHQGLREVAGALRVTGRAPDGVIEVVEGREQFGLGVQFHPELLWERLPEHLACFHALADAVRGISQVPSTSPQPAPGKSGLQA